MSGFLFGFLRFVKATSRKPHLIISLILICGLITYARGQSSDPARSANVVASVSSGRLIEIEKTKKLIPDVHVFNQHGKQVRLYTDLIKDKVVLLSFFYTRCTYICQIQGDILSRIQALLGDRLGKDVFLISISMDTQTDTPDRLKYWGNALSVKPGWALVNSHTPEMSKMIADFTGDYPGPQEVHSSLIFAGNDRTGEWIAVDGLNGPESLIKLINRLTSKTTSK